MARCKDHLDKEYTSQDAMCQKYGMNTTTYLSRLKSGMSKKDALTEPTESPVKDHLGNEYRTEKEMCEHYGVGRTVYRIRVKRMSKEEALTKSKGLVLDHLGKEYKSVYKMCKHYGIKRSAYDGRLKSGMSLEDALTLSIKDIGSKIDSRISNTAVSNYGQIARIIEYIDSSNIVIEFEDGVKTKTAYAQFMKVNAKNPKLDSGFKKVKIAYKLDDGTVGLYCKCRKCGKEYVGTWQDIYAHEC